MEIIDDNMDIEPDYTAILKHGTISTYNEYLKPTMGQSELLYLISLSEEFNFINVKKDEKSELANLVHHVPIQIIESSKEKSTKINVLLQAFIMEFKLEGPSLKADLVNISEISGRLMRALFEIVLKKGWLKLAVKALDLCKQIEMRIGSGQNLKFPKLALVSHVRPITRSVLKFELRIKPDFQWDKEVHGYEEPFWIIVGDSDEERILHHEYFMLKEQYVDEDHTINFTIPIYEPLPLHCYIHVLSDRWYPGEEDSDSVKVSFLDIILPKMHPPPTEILDLKLLSVTKALIKPAYQALYRKFRSFNSVQAQVFTKLYHTKDNVLVAAPTGSGKTICAEFAILRNHRIAPQSMLAVYIAPVEALAKERYQHWKKKFGSLGMRVVELTGDTNTDLKLFTMLEIDSIIWALG